MSIFFFQAEDGIRDLTVTGVQTCALPISKFGRQDSLNLAQDRHLLHLEPRVGGVLEVVQDQVREMRHLLVAQDHQRTAPFSFTSCFLIIWKSCCSFSLPRAISDSYWRINSLASALMRSSTLSSSMITRSSDTVRTRRSATGWIIPPATSFSTSWPARAAMRSGESFTPPSPS